VLASTYTGVMAVDGGSGQQLWQQPATGSVTNIATDGSLARVVTSEPLPAGRPRPFRYAA
jgi:hypothetical protein